MLSSNSLTQLNINDDPNSFLSTDNPQQSQYYSFNDNAANTEKMPSEPLNAPINVCYIGAGYVGGTSSAVMAYKCPEDMVTVTVCDVSQEKIDAWNSDKLPIYEPGLEEIVKKQRGKNLFFKTDLNSAIDAADIIFIAVGTPTKKKGFGAGQAADLKYVESAARKIAQIAKNSKIIVEKSTVPCNTAEHIRTILNANKRTQVNTKNNYLNKYQMVNDTCSSPDSESVTPNDHNDNNNNIITINVNLNSDNSSSTCNDDYNNLIESFSNINPNLADIDTYSDSNTCFSHNQDHNKQLLNDELMMKIRKERLNNSKSTIHFEILSNPEFLAEGTSVNDLLNPDRVLIGGLPTEEGQRAQNLLYRLYSYWIPEKKIITMGLWSSELSKLASNALLAQRISSINALSALCEEVGADIQEVSYAVGLDSRIGPKFLKDSVGFGGSCIKKDVLNLVYLLNAFNLPEAAEYWMQVIKMNEYRKQRFIKTILTNLFNTISGKGIAVLGFAFKKDTKDTRESAAITVVMSLLQEGAIVKIYDPKVTKEQIYADIRENCEPHEYEENIANTVICNSAYDAAYNSDALVICTEWDEFTSLDYQNIYNNMNKPSFIFDGRLILNHQELKKIGFVVSAIGKKI